MNLSVYFDFLFVSILELVDLINFVNEVNSYITCLEDGIDAS